tara:strand:+ start:65 stop:439 length:375 start_codon:yes stop_codon:yes gene_type:complete
MSAKQTTIIIKSQSSIPDPNPNPHKTEVSQLQEIGKQLTKLMYRSNTNGKNNFEGTTIIVILPDSSIINSSSTLNGNRRLSRDEKNDSNAQLLAHVISLQNSIKHIVRHGIKHGIDIKIQTNID